MSMSSNADLLHSAVLETLDANPDVVRRWLSNEPGSWGALAGKGVVAYRQRLGRRLTEIERRRVWALLWDRLAGLRLQSE